MGCSSEPHYSGLTLIPQTPFVCVLILLVIVLPDRLLRSVNLQVTGVGRRAYPVLTPKDSKDTGMLAKL